MYLHMNTAVEFEYGQTECVKPPFRGIVLLLLSNVSYTPFRMQSCFECLTPGVSNSGPRGPELDTPALRKCGLANTSL